MLLLDITTFVGRLHPMIIRLPIRFILLAVVFELLSYSVKCCYLKSAVSITLLLGFIGATAACVPGYLLSLSGDYNYQNLILYKFTGIAVAIVSGILFLLATKKIYNRIALPSKLFSTFFIGLFCMIAYTGYRGGNITHGSEYLSLNVLKGRKEKAGLG